ncbi:MAG: hypothetical protein JNM71_12855 [Flavobacterium lindanitolerans]|uniref:hypothetical protein n=1 Tax=Flavobacterium lindanitolerans TaxID=428988 RepID=UPI001A37160E|nr:hypothetical protein [Flavobacterium lindanitolerans]MBL7868897.1 hypothetical protein [Flavobacterium lindanitolerans]
MKGTFLALIAIILAALLFPFGLLFTLIVNLYKRKWKFSFARLGEQNLSIATSIDTSGNVVCKDLFDLTLRTKSGYRFGKRKETISSVLGKNKRDKTLTRTGKAVANILDFLDENHCLNSIDEVV